MSNTSNKSKVSNTNDSANETDNSNAELRETPNTPVDTSTETSSVTNNETESRVAGESVEASDGRDTSADTWTRDPQAGNTTSGQATNGTTTIEAERVVVETSGPVEVSVNGSETDTETK